MPLSGLCFTFRRGYLNVANDFIGELRAAGEPALERCDQTFLPFTDFGSVGGWLTRRRGAGSTQLLQAPALCLRKHSQRDDEAVTSDTMASRWPRDRFRSES